jgi:hypothetical protein
VHGAHSLQSVSSDGRGASQTPRFILSGDSHCFVLLFYVSLTRSMMQVNKQARVMSNGDVMGRGPTNEVSRQTAFSHKDTSS